MNKVFIVILVIIIFAMIFFIIESQVRVRNLQKEVLDVRGSIPTEISNAIASMFNVNNSINNAEVGFINPDGSIDYTRNPDGTVKTYYKKFTASFINPDGTIDYSRNVDGTPKAV